MLDDEHRSNRGVARQEWGGVMDRPPSNGQGSSKQPLQASASRSRS